MSIKKGISLKLDPALLKKVDTLVLKQNSKSRTATLSYLIDVGISGTGKEFAGPFKVNKKSAKKAATKKAAKKAALKK